MEKSRRELAEKGRCAATESALGGVRLEFAPELRAEGQAMMPPCRRRRVFPVTETGRLLRPVERFPARGTNVGGTA